VLTNHREREVQNRIRAELHANPGLAPVLAAFEAAPERFEIEMDSAGLELRAADRQTAVDERETGHRCRMKLFRPRDGKERLCAFFYKRSNLAWSRDRFSYGGVEFSPETFTDRDAVLWIGWLVSGFHPARRPERLRKSFLYDIPD
jgi:hypothetical protein